MQDRLMDVLHRERGRSKQRAALERDKRSKYIDANLMVLVERGWGMLEK